MGHLLVSAAAQQHGPPHVLILGILVIAIIGGLVFKAVNGRRRSRGHARRSRGPER